MTDLTVVIFTYRSPFGGVPEFVEDEIPFWEQAHKVLVISLAAHRQEHLVLGKSAEAFAVCPNGNPLKWLAYLVAGFGRLVILRELAAIIRRGPKGLLGRLKALAVHAQAAERYYRGARELLLREPRESGGRIVLYSYWWGPATDAAIALRARGIARDAVVVTRAHGSDLYERAQPGSYLPLRQYLLSRCDRVLPISLHGATYLKDHWRCRPERVEVSRLGIPDFLAGGFPQRNGRFHLVSCSYVMPIKRVNLIAEALSGLEGDELTWTHIGGGPGLGELRRTCENLLGSKRNISIELTGDLSHAEVLEFFSSRKVNVLVNVSKSEGIPVSMMEALCCGVPVIGPCVGGVPEIIEQGYNGRLLCENFTVEDLRVEIAAVMRMSSAGYKMLCANARRMWEERFSAVVNYPAVVASIEASRAVRQLGGQT